jgi:hypothetical protein
MEKCVFDRDTLFSVVIFRDRVYGEIVKQANKLHHLSSSSILELPNIKDQSFIWYYYSPELGVLNFANSEYKANHYITEAVVVLSADDLTPGGLGQKMLLGLTLDTDFIMVN